MQRRKDGQAGQVRIGYTHTWSACWASGHMQADWVCIAPALSTTSKRCWCPFCCRHSSRVRSSWIIPKQKISIVRFASIIVFTVFNSVCRNISVSAIIRVASLLRSVLNFIVLLVLLSLSHVAVIQKCFECHFGALQSDSCTNIAAIDRSANQHSCFHSPELIDSKLEPRIENWLSIKFQTKS